MSSVEQQFLEILALGLNPKAGGVKSQLESLYWLPFFQLGKQQGVLGVLWNGIQRLGVTLPKIELLKFYGLVQKIRQRNATVDAAVVSLCQQMSEQGIRIFVFKGQPLATLYPDVSLRQSGDIDFYCHPEDWQRAMA